MGVGMASELSCEPVRASCHGVGGVRKGSGLWTHRYDLTTPAVRGLHRRRSMLCVISARAVYLTRFKSIGNATAKSHASYYAIPLPALKITSSPAQPRVSPTPHRIVRQCLRRPARRGWTRCRRRRCEHHLCHCENCLDCQPNGGRLCSRGMHGPVRVLGWTATGLTLLQRRHGFPYKLVGFDQLRLQA